MKKLSKSALIVSALFAGACSKDSKTTETAAETPSVTANLTTGNAVMSAISTSLSSLGAAAPGTLVINAAGLNLATNASGNSLCAEHGQPLKSGLTYKKGDAVSDSDYLSQSDKNYSANLFFCLATLTSEDGASVETLLGSLAQAQSIICSFEEAFGTIEYTTAGTNLVASGSKKTTLSSTCWPQGTPEGITEITFTKGVATALAESSGYEKNLTFTGEVGEGDQKGEVSESLSYFNKDGIIGFRKGGAGKSPAVGDATQVTFNAKTGEVVVNVIDDRGGAGGADSSYRRTVRMKVKGTLDADLKFTGIESMQGIYATSGSNPEGDTALDTSSNIISLKGDSTNGFYGNVRVYNSGKGEEVFSGCTGAKTDCTTAELNDLIITDALNTSFYGSASRASWATQVADGLPPCYNSDDLTFDSLPTTGAFGICK